MVFVAARLLLVIWATVVVLTSSTNRSRPDEDDDDDQQQSSSRSTDLSDGDAHALYAAGLGAVHLANFTAAAFVGATAAAMLVSAVPWRWLGSIGIGFALVQLISAVIVLASQSHWSDVVGTVVFLAFLAWVFAASVRLVLALRRGEVAAPAAGL